MDVPILFASSAMATVFVTILVLELRSRTTTAKLLSDLSFWRKTDTHNGTSRPTDMALRLAAGGSPSDERLVELEQQNCDRQAGQGQDVVASNQQIRRMTGDLFEAGGTRINVVGWPPFPRMLYCLTRRKTT